MVFKQVRLPAGGVKYIPDDIELLFPEQSIVGLERLHLLAYIPWDEKYLIRVPEYYRDFFQHILPHLAARSTNIHTATCLGLMGEMIDAIGDGADKRVAYIALALHDSGWSRVSETEIANSLDYRGLAHSGQEEAIAVKAKQLHDVLGSEIARDVLQEYKFDPALSVAQKSLICTYVRNHTFPMKYKPEETVPTELVLVADTDRLWSYTHENFWQDTVRKNVPPQVYAHNLQIAIEGYFMTDPARAKARQLLAEREHEVAELISTVHAAR